MTDADRQHLARILGMLGSDHAGERAAAALQAEAFRKKHGLTWEKLLAPPDETPEPPAWKPPPPEPPADMPPPPEPFTYHSPVAQGWTAWSLDGLDRTGWLMGASYVVIALVPLFIGWLFR